MRRFDNWLFTPAEAAVLTRLSLKAVNNAIENMVPAVVRSGTGESGRFLDQRALLALALEYRLANRARPCWSNRYGQPPRRRRFRPGDGNR